MMNNKQTKIAITVAMGLGLSSGAFAAASTTQTATYEVTAINEISVSASPAAMTVNSATAGSGPIAAADTNTTWAITNNAIADAKKLTASIDTDMPAGTTLSVNMGAPTGATSAGVTTLSSVAADVVTLIDPVAESGLGITYGLTATVAAGVVSSDSKTVTFTLINSI